MTGLAPALLVVALVFALGAWTAVSGSRPEAGLTLMMGAAVLALAAVSRFAAAGADPVSGQAFAVVVAVAALALRIFAGGLRRGDRSP